MYLRPRRRFPPTASELLRVPLSRHCLRQHQTYARFQDRRPAAVRPFWVSVASSMRWRSLRMDFFPIQTCGSYPTGRRAAERNNTRRLNFSSTNQALALRHLFSLALFTCHTLTGAPAFAGLGRARIASDKIYAHAPRPDLPQSVLLKSIIALVNSTARNTTRKPTSPATVRNPTLLNRTAFSASTA